MPPVVDSDANSSLGVVRKSYHHQGRGNRVDDRADGELRRDREAVALVAQARAGDRGVDGELQRVESRRGGAADQPVGDLAIAHDVQLEPVAPVGFAALTSSIDVVPRVDSVNGMPAAPAADAPAISPSVCIRRVKPVGAMPNGSADRPPRIVDGRVDVRRGAQDRGVELDVLERLAGAGERQLALGRAVGVVEGGLRRATLGDRAQVVDRERGVEAALLAVRARAS